MLVDLARELNKPRMTADYLWYTAWPDGPNRYRSTEQAARKRAVGRGTVDEPWPDNQGTPAETVAEGGRA